MRVLVFGLGYTGTELATRLDDDGHDVMATVSDLNSPKINRHDFPVEYLELRESRQIIHRLEKHGWLSDERHSLVFTAGPPRRESNDESLRLLEKFLSAVPFDRLHNFIYISSTSVYGNRNGGWVDEDSRLDPISRSGHLKMESEHLVKSTLPFSVPAIIIRPGGIYGPGRNPAKRYLSDEYELVGEGKKWVNRIHVTDLARIIQTQVERDEPEILNAVDNNPVQLIDLLRFVYNETGRDFGELESISWEEAREKYSEMKLGLLKPSKRVSAKRLLETYDFEYEYPSIYDGLRKLLEE